MLEVRIMNTVLDKWCDDIIIFIIYLCANVNIFINKENGLLVSMEYVHLYRI